MPNREKLYERKDYFTKSNSVVDKKGKRLLHIYEIEALIMTDVLTFNNIYNCDLEEVENVMLVPEPKEHLKRVSAKKYNESHNPEIFNMLDFNKTLNCEYFKRFIEDLDKILL